MFLFKKKEEAKEKAMISRKSTEQGLKGGEFIFYYQPEFDLKSGKIIGLEALLRWETPNGIISPAEFIPALENSGLIQRFTEPLLHQALTDLKKVHEIGYPDMVMAVNLSALQLTDPDLIKKIKKVLEETKTDPKFLECEITESQQVDLPNMQETVFKELKNLGVSISIDDFGTGYSSFDYLRYLDIKKLKIDCSFVRTLEENARNKKILSLIIKLGHDLNVPVLAEGIETTVQKEWLEKNECDFGQGFWFSRGLPLDQLISFLKKGRKK